MQFSNVIDFTNWLINESKFMKHTSLDKITYLMKLFSNPHKKIKCIHVAGTNGKGSTVSYLKTIFMKAGYNVGTFISPHIIEFNERISYNNKFIDDETLLSIANEILSKYDDLEKRGFEHLSFFEFVTAIAFIYFGRIKKLDIVILEAGLGGRLDATNIVKPKASIITNVSYDHMAQLGNTLELILNEKLGIVKEKIPLFTGVKDNSLLEICKNVCNEKNSKLYSIKDTNLSILESDLMHNLFMIDDETFETRLIGTHQIYNALIAIEVVKYLNSSSNFNISSEILDEGIKDTIWPGRLEKINNDPLIYIDGGHNIGCIDEVINFIKANLDYKIRVVCAFSKDKDYSLMIKKIDEIADEIIFTKYEYNRSAKEDDLIDLSNCRNKILIDNSYDAADYCMNNASPFTLIIGSLYLISEVRKYILDR